MPRRARVHETKLVTEGLLRSATRAREEYSAASSSQIFSFSIALSTKPEPDSRQADRPSELMAREQQLEGWMDGWVEDASSSELRVKQRRELEVRHPAQSASSLAGCCSRSAGKEVRCFCMAAIAVATPVTRRGLPRSSAKAYLGQQRSRKQRSSATKELF
mmetsp:Transcript_6882/g.12084  ORF Transcript_6882/g.12084 Transcript_6882/m.12084 type:complete len:161 (-) Transcript_6882:47-529(-)